MDTKELSLALHAAGFTLYSQQSYCAKSDAQKNLSSKTHYADDSTLRFFHGRILSCQSLNDGLVLGIVESVAGNCENSFRVYRPCFFDIDGKVISRPSLSDAFKTGKQARAEFWRIANSLDALAVTREALTRQIKFADGLRAILATGV